MRICAWFPAAGVWADADEVFLFDMDEIPESIRANLEDETEHSLEAYRHLSSSGTNLAVVADRFMGVPVTPNQVAKRNLLGNVKKTRGRSLE